MIDLHIKTIKYLEDYRRKTQDLGFSAVHNDTKSIIHERKIPINCTSSKLETFVL